MHLLEFVESLLSIFNSKAAKRKKGIHATLMQLENYLLTTEDTRPIIWFHCASLGEFYQAEPLIKLLHSDGLYRVLLSFYSPSGYEQCKEHSEVDSVFYLPVDTTQNAKYLIQLIKPHLVIFAKYEFWFNYLHQLNEGSYNYIYISTLFRKNHYFFQFPLSVMAIPILRKSKMFYVQNIESYTIAKAKGFKGLVTGDTRIDAVLSKRETIETDDRVKAFCSNNKVLVIGSSWPEDDRIYKEYIDDNPMLKVILAPHEINNSRINGIEKIFSNKTIRYSSLNQKTTDKQILIIDNIGKLFGLYSLADVVYIGGGFGAGIHNTLEPAVYGKPIIFGSKYTKFQEAIYFVDNKMAISVGNNKLFSKAMDWALTSEVQSRVKKDLIDYFQENKNSTEKIYSDLTDIL